MNRKGSALFFLMELLLIVVVIFTLTSVAYKFATNEGKIRQFETYNLALFLERIPSIEGNFEYAYTFELPANVEITNTTVSTDEPQRVEKRFYQSYINPREYQFEFEGENITKLYFIKSGVSVNILTPEAYKEAKIQKYALPQTTANFSNNYVIKTDMASFEYISQSFKTTVIEKADTTLQANLVWYAKEVENSQTILIYYSEDAVTYAQAMYTALNDKFDGQVALVPTKFFDEVPIVTTPTIKIEIQRDAIAPALIELKELFNA